LIWKDIPIWFDGGQDARMFLNAGFAGMPLKKREMNTMFKLGAFVIPKKQDIP